MMQYLNSNALAVAMCVALLSACGGGGGGGGGGGAEAPGSGPAAPSDRRGTLTYSFIDKVYGVDMARNTTQVLLRIDYNRSLVGIAAGPDGVSALASNSSSTGPTSRLTIQRPDGSKEAETDYNFIIRSLPKFSGDGKQLAMNGLIYRSGTAYYFLQVVDRAGKALYYFDDHESPAWLPDGRLLMRSRLDGKLYITDSSDPLEPLSEVPNSAGALAPAVSPDGTEIAYTAQASTNAPRHIYMMSIGGGSKRQVTTSTNSEETRALFSPSGKELLITSYGCVSGIQSGAPVGSVDDDLMHVIPADATMLNIDGDRSSSPTQLRDEDGKSRCAFASLSWR
jgi:WD40 repeat protein